jgi:signal recognition particle subunit SEC65
MKGVPRPVVDVVQRCLAKDAASRPSFNEVVEMLKQLQITMV